MNNITSLRGIEGLPYVVVSNRVIVDASQSFIEMTEFQFKDIINKDIENIFSALRVGPYVSYENIDDKADYFLFAKSLEVRFVNIYVMEDRDGKVYVFAEKPNSGLDVKFAGVEALCSHNVFGVAVFSTPEITLLKANQTWLNFLDKPFNNRENSLGKRISEFISGWVGSASEYIWKDVLATQKPFYSDEYMYEFERGVTYWQASLAPVFENGILKYCIEITTDITEKVLNRKKTEEQTKIIEDQKRELEIVVDNMSDGFSVVDKDGNYININKTVKQWLKDARANKVGDTLDTFKYFDMQGNKLSKEDLPASRVARGERIEKYELLMKADGYQKYFSTSGTPIYDENGSFIKGVINTRDITDIVLSRKKLHEQFGQVDSSLSRQAEGAGIGLSLVKRFVEALDGCISVKSKVGKSSTFTIMLPDEQFIEESDLDTAADLMDNRLVQNTTVEFSDIYL